MDELKQLASLGRIKINDLLNPKSKAFKETGADLKTITSGQAGKLIFENPRVMVRPVFTDGERLALGFKPEEVEKLL